MGGTDEKTMAGFRTHINNGEVHIHDDSRSLKFSMDQSDFKKDLEASLKELDDIKEGFTIIEGKNGNNLCIGKESGRQASYFMFITGNTTLKELKDFLKDL